MYGKYLIRRVIFVWTAGNLYDMGSADGQTILGCLFNLTTSQMLTLFKSEHGCAKNLKLLLVV